MKKGRMAIVIVAAVTLPLLLSIATYLISLRSFDTAIAVVPTSSGKIARPRTPPRSPHPSEEASDHCSEPEHVTDPQCASANSHNGTGDTSRGGAASDSGSLSGPSRSGSSGGSGSEGSEGSGSSGGSNSGSDTSGSDDSGGDD